jgi:NAD(P)-dependent dehydrogenase (short-subunit alcohol dehydrogenase family)
VSELAGRTVVVTGASRGIGAAAAVAIGAAGGSVVAHYGSYREGAEKAVSQLPEERKRLVQADFSAPGSARRFWRTLLDETPRVDAVVVNAAMSRETPFDGDDETWDTGWDELMRVNVLEPASLIREAVAHFREHGGGVVITLSSWAAQQGSAIATLPAYAASKAAVKAVTQTVARNYGKEGVLAYVVAPGIVRTRMSEISAVARGGIDKVNAILALGEMVPAEEVGDLIALLASGRCRHLSGATIDVNGATYVR